MAQQDRPFEILRQRLRQITDDPVDQSDLDYQAEQIIATIKLRTQRGNYLTSQTGGRSEPRTQYSPGHAKKRQAIGLPIDRVTLFMGEVGVLEAIHSRTTTNSIEVGYITGLSEARAKEIGEYLNTLGAGVNRVTYQHIGLTQAEEEQLRESLVGHVREKVQRIFR